LKPDFEEAYRLRGFVHNNKGEYAEAIRLKPDFAKAYCYRGSVYGDKGDPASAQADYAKAKQLGFEW